MRHSTERILTTHTGSLPRPMDLVELVYQKESGELIEERALSERIKSATREIVQRQVAAGVDIISDGEAGKPGYANYVKDRLTGFDGEGRGVRRQAEADEFPEYYERLNDDPYRKNRRTPACTGPVTLADPQAVQRDIANFRDALDALGDQKPVEAFMTAASPGVIALFLQNQYYPSVEAYLEALAEAMRPEYEAIAQAGFILQLDCPDLAMSRTGGIFAEMTLPEFRDRIRLHLAALNHAVANIPPEQMRMHLCWGNYEGPHRRDVPLADILDVVFTARPSAVSFEGANPRHAHEWAVFNDMQLPQGKTIIPGVIDSTTNYVEHPTLIAQRIVSYANLVGRENVIVGSDCGFGTFIGRNRVDERVVYAKFETMAEGARIASDQLWG
jgi:5-methyltetrahydropteroyltriglutamate--homocysteine methyltransferase